MSDSGDANQYGDNLLGLGGRTGRTLVVTCPKCHSRYEVNTKQLAALSDSPMFHCSVCSQVFTADSDQDLKRIFAEARGENAFVVTDGVPATVNQRGGNTSEVQSINLTQVIGGDASPPPRPRVDPNADTGEFNAIRQGQANGPRPAAYDRPNPVVKQEVEGDLTRRVAPYDRESWSTMSRPITVALDTDGGRDFEEIQQQVRGMNPHSKESDQFDDFTDSIVGRPFESPSGRSSENITEGDQTDPLPLHGVAESSYRPRSASSLKAELAASGEVDDGLSEEVVRLKSEDGPVPPTTPSLSARSQSSNASLDLTRPATVTLPPEPNFSSVPEVESSNESSQLAVILFLVASLMVVPLAAFLLIQFNPPALSIRSLLPHNVQAPPTNLFVREARFKKVTLEDGEEVGVISGIVQNDSNVVVTGILLEGYVNGQDDAIIASQKLSLGASVNGNRLRTLTRPMIADLQSGKMVRRVRLAPNEESEFSLAVLGATDISAVTSFGVRIYSADLEGR